MCNAIKLILLARNGERKQAVKVTNKVFIVFCSPSYLAYFFTLNVLKIMHLSSVEVVEFVLFILRGISDGNFKDFF